jgi:hypothetical protein
MDCAHQKNFLKKYHLIFITDSIFCEGCFSPTINFTLFTAPEDPLHTGNPEDLGNGETGIPVAF